MGMINEICTFAPKSKIKAGEATKDGQYIFFTSSEDESKKYNDYIYDGEGIIMGTGGNATLHYYNGKYATSTDCLVLLPDKEIIDCKYLYYFFLSNMSLLEAGFKGAGLRHTNKKYIGNIEINQIPTKDQQLRVVSILDTVTSLIVQQQKEINLLDELIKSRFVEMFGDIVHNTKKWEEKPFSEIATSRLGKMLDSKKQTGKSSFPYLANFNVQWFEFDFSKLNEMDFDEKDQIEFQLIDGDLLVCEGGEIGRCAIWHNEIDNCFFQKALHRVRCNTEIIIPEYLAWWFKHMCECNGFLDIEGAKATIAHLPGTKLKKLLVVVPPIELQTLFADFITKVEQQKSTVQKSIEKLETLKKSLMQEYFG